jgi:hypothetical protein
VRWLIAKPACVFFFKKIEQHIKELCSDLPQKIRLRRAELEANQRRIENFIEFIGEGRGSQALAEALGNAERRVTALREEIEMLEANRDSVFEPPPMPWVQERLARFQQTLEGRTEQAALLLRKVLGPITLEPTQGDIGRPYYRAHSKLDILALLEEDPEPGGPEPGPTKLQKWGGGNRTRGRGTTRDIR